jgi:membrane peptidoglycan carboxypeptidase
VGKSSQIQGASTITQQLVKNLMLNNNKTIKRKLQETILAQRLTKKRYNIIQEEYPDLNDSETAQKTKEKIVETYLNYVYFGNQSYGIDAAAHNYFHTTPNQLTLIQSSIIAALPQAPSAHNPVSNPQNVLGYRTINLEEGSFTAFPHQESTRSASIRGQLSGSIVTINPELGCLGSLANRGDVTIPINGTDQFVPYTPGRKDLVLCRMYEDGYITLTDVRDAFLATKNLEVYRSRFGIKAPHFVFRVRKYIEENHTLQ